MKKGIISVATIAGISLGAVAMANAQTVTSGKVNNDEGHGGRNGGHVQGKFHGGKGGEELAKILGISTTTLKARLDTGEKLDQIITSYGLSTSTVKAQMEASRLSQMKIKLAEEVASGKITQAKMDEILKDIASGKMPNIENHGNGDGKGKKGGHMKMTEELVSVLGISTSTLNTRLQSGENIETIIASLGKSTTTVKAQMDSIRDKKISDDVASGNITQEEADKIKARHEEIKNSIGSESKPKFFEKMKEKIGSFFGR